MYRYCIIMSLRLHQLLLAVAILERHCEKKQNLLHASVAEPLVFRHLLDMFGRARLYLGIVKIILPSNVFHFEGFSHLDAEGFWKPELCV